MNDNKTKGFDEMPAEVEKELLEGLKEMNHMTSQTGMPSISGKKNDSNKADLSLIPKVALVKAAEAFQVGEKKYGRYNFYQGMEASRLVAALLRHITAWMEGQDHDPEDGQHHLGSVIACASMILKTEELGTLIDNRYKQINTELETRSGAKLSKVEL